MRLSKEVSNMLLLLSSSFLAKSATATTLHRGLVGVGRRGAASSVAFIPSTSRSFHHGISSPATRCLSTSATSNAGPRKRRIKPRHSSDTLSDLLDLNESRAKKGLEPITMMKSAPTTTETEAAVGEGGEEKAKSTEIVEFPLTGKSVEDVPPRLRFAPSPTGSLHVGGARTALYNWLVAKKGQVDFPKSDAGFVLRVEDTDLARSTKESELSVLQDLEWLGLHWDEGPDSSPIDMNTFRGPYRQSERNEIYVNIANKLLAEDKAYRCFCTKEELDEMRAKQEAAGIPPRYDNTWRDADPALVQQKLDEGAPFTVRFKVPAGARVVIDDIVRGTVSWDAEATVGDFILLRSNGVPVYNFCVAVDDAAMGVTTVIRAEEHLTNTLRQGLILDALDAPRPRYAHCSLILGEDKQKLSKRHGATSCNQYRLDGFLPDAMINYLSLLGWNDGSDNEIYTREELIDAFEVDRIVKSPSVFDMDKLRWVNSQHLKMLTIEEIAPMVREQFVFAGILKSEDVDEKAEQFVLASTTLAKQMMETTKCAVLNAEKVLGYGLPKSFSELEDEAREMVQLGFFYDIGMRLVEAFRKGEIPQPDEANLMEAFTNPGGQFIEEDNETGGTAYSYPHAYKVFMKQMAKELGVKGKFLFHPVRLALTGEMSGQDVTKQLSLVTMASSGTSSSFDKEKLSNLIVGFEERIEQLESFLETIPEEFRTKAAPAEKDKNKAKNAGASEKAQAEASTSETKTVDPRETYDGPPITALDIRVGQIKKVWEHEEADKLFCEEVDVGEDEPRMIASGLRPFFDKEDLEDRKVLVLCNLKARKMVGFPSHGMVLCASNDDHTEVKFVSPPPDAKIGERVTVPGWDFSAEDAAPFAENKVGKKKIFEKIAPFLKTSEHGVPEFLGSPLMTSAGVCTSPLPKGQVA